MLGYEQDTHQVSEVSPINCQIKKSMDLSKLSFLVKMIRGCNYLGTQVSFEKSGVGLESFISLITQINFKYKF